MTAWRSNEEVTESGMSAARNNPDGMSLGKGVGFGDINGTATVIHKDEELPYETGNRFMPVDGGLGMTALDGIDGMKLEGDAGDVGREHFNRNVDDSNNKE